MALEHLSRRVQGQQLARQVPDGPLHALLRASPLLGAEPRQRRPLVAGADVAADAVDLVGRHEQTVALGVAQLQVLALLAVGLQVREAGELGDAVLDVDDEVAGAEVGEEVDAAARARTGESTLLDEAEQLGVCQQSE